MRKWFHPWHLLLAQMLAFGGWFVIALWQQDVGLFLAFVLFVGILSSFSVPLLLLQRQHHESWSKSLQEEQDLYQNHLQDDCALIQGRLQYLIGLVEQQHALYYYPRRKKVISYGKETCSGIVPPYTEFSSEEGGEEDNGSSYGEVE